MIVHLFLAPFDLFSQLILQFVLYFQVKTNTGLFPKKLIVDALEEAPGGVWIVLEGTHPNGVELMSIGYKYNSKRILFFVATRDAGSTFPGEPYQIKFVDGKANVCICCIPCLELISE